jgi:hypothetical protein
MKRNERASADAGFGVLSAVAHHLCGTTEHNCFIPGAVCIPIAGPEMEETICRPNRLSRR